MSFLTHPLRRFAQSHDDIPAFHAAYLVLTFLAAAMLQMGVFLIVIIAHMALDTVKYREVLRYKWHRTIEGVLRESLLDLALIGIGFVFAVYLHHTIGLMGVGGVVLAQLTVLRGIGTLIPKVHILHHFLETMFHLHRYLHHPHPNVGKRWTVTEEASFVTILVCVILLFMSPVLMEVRAEAVVRVVLEQLVPWLHGA